MFFSPSDGDKKHYALINKIILKNDGFAVPAWAFIPRYATVLSLF